MKPAAASLVNAILLVTLSGWGYLASESPSVTALIPTTFGVVLLLMNPGIRSKNPTVTHAAVLVTLLVLLGLGMPLRGALGRGDAMAIGRVVVMMASTVFAMVVFIRAFIAARRERAAAA